ncbi:MAG: hypothetical protein AAF889_08845 [Cyanobacteria bacterium P01_D01_bin.73]
MTVNLFDLRNRIAEAENRVVWISMEVPDTPVLPSVYAKLGVRAVDLSTPVPPNALVFLMPVAAECYGDWAIHFELRGSYRESFDLESGVEVLNSCMSDRFGLSHIPTGLLVQDYSSLLEARLAAFHVEKSGIGELVRQFGVRFSERPEGKSEIARFLEATKVFDSPFGGDFRQESLGGKES